MMWLLLFVSSTCLAGEEISNSVDDLPSHQYLPENFQVYIHDHEASVTAKPGDSYVVIPTNNHYHITPGCYVLCFDKHQGVYETKDHNFVVGQYRIPGSYRKNLCIPGSFMADSKTPEVRLNQICNQMFSQCDGQCEVNYQTGQWFD